MIWRSEVQSSPGQFYHEESKWIKVMVVSSIPVKVMLYNQSDTKFLKGNEHSMQCKKLNLKLNCIEFCNSTTYSIECKSDLGRLTVYCLSPFVRILSWIHYQQIYIIGCDDNRIFNTFYITYTYNSDFYCTWLTWLSNYFVFI